MQGTQSSLDSIQFVQATRNLMSVPADVKSSSRNFSNIKVDIKVGTLGLVDGDGRVCFEYGGAAMATVAVEPGDITPHR